MALINCPECEKEISDKVKACPHCGYPMEESKTTQNTKTKKSNKLLLTTLISIAVVLVGICVYYFTSQTSLSPISDVNANLYNEGIEFASYYYSDTYAKSIEDGNSDKEISELEAKQTELKNKCKTENEKIFIDASITIASYGRMSISMGELFPLLKALIGDKYEVKGDAGEISKRLELELEKFKRAKTIEEIKVYADKKDDNDLTKDIINYLKEGE